MAKAPTYYVYDSVSPTQQWMKERREKSLSMPMDAPLYLNVGHFICWYSAVELGLTMLLYALVNNHPSGAKFDSEMFHLLSLGMDAKVKSQRLKQAASKRDIQVPDELAWRIRHFNKVIVPIRNRIVHGTLHWPEGEDMLVVHTVSDFIPWHRAQSDDSIRRSYKIDGSELYEHGVWLNLFAYDLGHLSEALADRSELLLETYASAVPRSRYLERQRLAAEKKDEH